MKSEPVCCFCNLQPVSNCIQMIREFLTATFQCTMRQKRFQWVKFLFRHSSNSRRLSRQKFYNEIACVFTAHDASKNADSRTTNGWRHFGQLEQRIVSYPIRKKSPDSGFFTCDPTKKCIMPSSRERLKGIIGRGHDLRLGQFQPFGPGVGSCLKRPCPGLSVVGGEANRK